MASAVLWQTADQTVTLIDVPRSIAAAQGTLQQPCHDQLLSVEPLQAPFPSNEPKSEKARANLNGNLVDQELHGEYVALLEHALLDVRGSHTGDWCLPRPCVQDTPRVAKKRKLDEGSLALSVNVKDQNSTGTASTGEELPNDLLSSLARAGSGTAHEPRMRLLGIPPATDDPEEAIVHTHVIANPSADVAILEVSVSAKDVAHHFHVPPQSSFYLGDCSEVRPFRAAVRAKPQQHDTRKDFDFILLDPPWPNRSVKRTHKTAGSTYSTMTTLTNVRDVLLGMDLDMLMAEDCLVGVWTTNRPAVRDLLLGEDGLFDCWGVELVEEWIWLKTTAHGEPVTQLDALWRKPYEILLLGRKRRHASPTPPASEDIMRRVLISVPDLHSRKPCLKSLVETLMADAEDYRALEVFARHLVAGWWSWGDECIKFNWDGYWRSVEAAHAATA
ncbi:hypothetical protein LTR85_004638 [Meristemomyces frigidus]|nr:hypothetical protein LTR85_004638 [Meristemomyces frigidus]